MAVYYILMALILGLAYPMCIRKPSKKKNKKKQNKAKKTEKESGTIQEKSGTVPVERRKCNARKKCILVEYEP